MARTSKKLKLLVYYQKNLIGHLSRELNGAIEFQYDESWINNGYAISLSLPLTKSKYKGEAAAHYFQNLLPDNKNILEAVALKFGAQSIEAVDILAHIGRDCVGAISLYKADKKIEFEEKIKVKTLSSKQIANKIKNLSRDNPLGMEDNDFKLSLAGAQEKMALLYWQNKWCEPKGATATSHIIKKQMGQVLGGIDFSESVENEHFSLELAKFFGLNTCDTDIEKFEDEKVLV